MVLSFVAAMTQIALMSGPSSGRLSLVSTLGLHSYECLPAAYGSGGRWEDMGSKCPLDTEKKAGCF